ncbi:MAG: hypothetical protein ACYC4U_17685 [Pirellulaceae bacterium]
MDCSNSFALASNALPIIDARVLLCRWLTHLMPGLAMFALKDPSLLAFDHRRGDENMKKVFHIERIPSDTQMREILDPLDPEELRQLFCDVFRQLQRLSGMQ